MTYENLKVCLVEYENHYEVIRSLTHFFQISKWQVTIISHKNCLDNLYDIEGSAEIKLKLLDDDSVGDHLAFDLVIYITPFDFYKIKDPVIDPKLCYLLIHNHNYWLAPVKNIYILGRIDLSYWRHAFRLLKYWRPGTLRKNTKWLNSFKGIISPSLVIYNDHPKRNRLSGFLDVSYSNYFFEKENDKEVFKIVIPGSVTKEKDPTQIISVISQLANTKKLKIELILLGENRIIPTTSLKSYNSNYIKLRTFNEPVSQQVFDSIMKTADVGIISIQKHKDYKGIMEIKGKTNITGGINDMYRFRVPFIIPEFYPVIIKDNSIYKYSDVEEIGTIISNLITIKASSDDNTNEIFNGTKKFLFEKNTEMLQHLLTS